MADTPKTQGPKPTMADDPWRSGRARFGMQQFRMGRDKKWHFSGQQPGEEVRMVVRKHWWFLVSKALPLIGAIVLLLVASWATVSLPPSPVWDVLEVVAIVLVIGAAIWFASRDLIKWWYDTFIITDKRIINSYGLLQPKRQEIPIEKVQQVGLDISPLGFMLGFGDVHTYLVGGQLVMEQVPEPKKVKDAILGLTEVVKSKKKPDQPPPKPKDPDISKTLEDLAKGKPVPKLPDADEGYPPLRNPDRYRGPRRTFGGFFRIPAEVHYYSGEYTVKYIQRSQYVLIRNLILPALALLLLLPIALIAPATTNIPVVNSQFWWLIAALLFFGIIAWGFVAYVSYIDDIYILTNRRVIDIERKLIFTFEARIEAEYKNIRDIRVQVPNVIQRMFDVGDVYVETPGNSPDIVFHTVDHPFLIQDLVLGIKNHKEQADKISRENDEKKTLQTWFDTVLAKLEESNQTRSAPDLRNLDLLTAMYQAQERELDVMVLGEDVPTTALAPGHVIHQNPPPGTLMSKGGRIEVVLSRRPSMAEHA